jgi:hypothetical protein
VIGVLSCLSKLHEPQFFSDEQAILSIAAEFVAIAVADRKVYHRIHRLTCQMTRVLELTISESVDVIRGGLVKAMRKLLVCLKASRVSVFVPGEDGALVQLLCVGAPGTAALQFCETVMKTPEFTFFSAAEIRERMCPPAESRRRRSHRARSFLPEQARLRSWSPTKSTVRGL